MAQGGVIASFKQLGDETEILDIPIAGRASGGAPDRCKVLVSRNRIPEESLDRKLAHHMRFGIYGGANILMWTCAV